VPPLRDRPEDFTPLAERVLEVVCLRFGVLPKRLAGEVRELLTAYDWRRNNVRELRNAVERMVVMADGELIRLDHLPPAIAGEAGGTPDADAPTSFQDLKADAERRIILAALERHEWQVTRTAETLGLADHSSLLKIIRRLGIQRD
jgi:DNA-binding NtrC family response regulator